MLELKAKLLFKRTIQTTKAVPFDICDPFITKYWRITALTYWKLKYLSHIFYSGGKSLLAQITIYTGANPDLIHQFYEYGYLNLVYLDSNLTELSKFPKEMK